MHVECTLNEEAGRWPVTEKGLACACAAGTRGHACVCQDAQVCCRTWQLSQSAHHCMYVISALSCIAMRIELRTRTDTRICTHAHTCRQGAHTHTRTQSHTHSFTHTHCRDSDFVGVHHINCATAWLANCSNGEMVPPLLIRLHLFGVRRCR